MTIEVKQYIKERPGGALFALIIDTHKFDSEQHVRAAISDALLKQGVPLLPNLKNFPLNLGPKSRVEVETDSIKPGLMVVRYYGALNKPMPKPAAKPYTDDEDDEL